jgi:phosphoglycolate phosphatase-like HAD superfamily hydrolase
MAAEVTPGKAEPAEREVRHLVWDWNGTLLHDIEAVLVGTNASLATLGLPPITLETYRSAYCQPIPLFYERLVGRPVSDDEFRRLDAAYFDEYHRHLPRCALTDGVEELLGAWQAGGGTQSLLSMYPHERLVPLVERLGVSRWFRRVDGVRGPTGGLKAEHLVRHLEALELDAGEVMLIGDSLDDAASAAKVGARCVLYGGGFHSPESLAAAGVPVVNSLADAVALAW